jgi:hypothetical protein
VAAFDADRANLLRIENTGSGWMVRVAVALPPGITRVQAGELGGPGGRDELLFLGGGLVEVVSRGDFDFSDVRFLSMGPHAAATFGDFDADGNGDALIASRTALELWSGDGATTIAMGGMLDLGAFVIDLAAIQRDAAGVLEAAVLLEGGRIEIVRMGAAGLELADGTDTGPSALRLFADDFTGDARPDVAVVGSDAAAWVWTTH